MAAVKMPQVPGLIVPQCVVCRGPSWPGKANAFGTDIASSLCWETRSTANSKKNCEEDTMNEQAIKGKWREIKGEIQKVWGDITGDDLDKTEGNMKSVAGMIQQKYGDKQDDVSRRLGEIVDRFSDKAADTSEEMKQKMRNKM
jgi:uncharacterized protein YjbJ (UPF0337 family)